MYFALPLISTTTERNLSDDLHDITEVSPWIIMHKVSEMVNPDVVMSHFQAWKSTQPVEKQDDEGMVIEAFCDYLENLGYVVANSQEICVIDVDDLLQDPDEEGDVDDQGHLAV